MKKLREIVKLDEMAIVTNKDGTPKDFYHGSVKKGLDKLDVNASPVRTRSGPQGTYFTSNPHSAYNYTKKPGSKESGEVYKAHLDLNNPLDITNDIKKHRKSGLSFGDAKRKALEKLTPNHDSVIFKGDSYNPDEYVAMKPDSIKLINNKKQ